MNGDFLDGDGFLGFILVICFSGSDFVDNVHALDDLSEDGVRAVEVRVASVFIGLDDFGVVGVGIQAAGDILGVLVDEELAAIGVGAGIGHGDSASDIVEVGADFVFKAGAWIFFAVFAIMVNS